MVPSVNFTTGRTTWKPEVLVDQRILLRPLRSMLLVLCRKVIANGASHSPDHTPNGVVSLPGLPVVSSFLAPGSVPLHLDVRIGNVFLHHGGLPGLTGRPHPIYLEQQWRRRGPRRPSASAATALRSRASTAAPGRLRLSLLGLRERQRAAKQTQHREHHRKTSSSGTKTLHIRLLLGHSTPTGHASVAESTPPLTCTQPLLVTAAGVRRLREALPPEPSLRKKK